MLLILVLIKKNIKGITQINKSTKNKHQIVNGSVNNSGQIFIELTLKFPTEINGVDISKYFQFNVVSQIFINYGDLKQKSNAALFDKHADRISKNAPNKDTKSEDFHKTHKENCEAAVSEGAQLTYTLDGRITIKMTALTDNFLPDLNLNLGKLTFMIVMGQNAPSGLNPGIYLYVESNIVKSLLKDVLKPILGDTEKYIGAFIGKPGLGAVPGMDAINKNANKHYNKAIKHTKPMKFSLFITENSSGFMFQDGNWQLQCVYIKAIKQGGKPFYRCQSGSKFINAIMTDGSWVASAISGFFNDLGDLADDAGDDLVAGGKAVETGIVDTGEAISQGASDVGDFARATWNAAK